MERPEFGDIRSPSHDTLRNGIPSPRIEHFDGEVPPALSPLDALAAQGRLLARQLDESMRRDRRMSRLPPSSVARSLSQPRPGYFRSPSSGDSTRSGRAEGPPTPGPAQEQGKGQGHEQGGGIQRRPTQKGNPEMEEPKFRPQSEHPRLSAISDATATQDDHFYDEDATPRNERQSRLHDFNVPRAESPEEDLSMRGSTCEAPRRFYAPDDGPRRFYEASAGVSLITPSRNSSGDSSRLAIPRTLAPPVSPLSRPSSSSRVNHPESSDDDYSSSNAGSTFSQPRKLSSSSAMSLPYSPMSTSNNRSRRSPSMSSETSGGQLPRPSFNFSRPMSRSSTNLSSPTPLAPPQEQEPANQPATMDRLNKPSPIVVPSADMTPRPGEDPTSANSSYVYAKYALPRGRDVSRDSVIFSSLQTPHFQWQEPLFESPPPPSAPPARIARTPSPEAARPVSVYSNKARSMYECPASDRAMLAATPSSPAPSSPANSHKGKERVRLSADVARQPSPARSKNEDKEETASSTGSASTLRPQTAQTTGSGNQTTGSTKAISADEHVSMGIDCHEKGSLNESTYHLRIAAKQDHPTGMLLYALACRHGWGMRPNQREGVRWLRKAVEAVGPELLDNNNTSVPSKAKELQKAYRAQFALSVYELGVSHLNGWGIEQDKGLALRCFEIASQWGRRRCNGRSGLLLCGGCRL
ncbi:hypothetical protein AWENTII_001847 [Aspergillus wentii]